MAADFLQSEGTVFISLVLKTLLSRGFVGLCSHGSKAELMTVLLTSVNLVENGVILPQLHVLGLISEQMLTCEQETRAPVTTHACPTLPPQTLACSGC